MDGSAFSRRLFLKSFGTAAATAATAQVEAVAPQLEKANSEKIRARRRSRHAEGQWPDVAAATRAARDAARRVARIIPASPAPRKVCDRATCGACTVLLDGSRFIPARNWPSRRRATRSRRSKGLAQDGKL